MSSSNSDPDVFDNELLGLKHVGKKSEFFLKYTFGDLELEYTGRFLRSKKVSSKFGVYKLLVFCTILAAKTNPTSFDHGNRCF